MELCCIELAVVGARKGARSWGGRLALLMREWLSLSLHFGTGIPFCQSKYAKFNVGQGSSRISPNFITTYLSADTTIYIPKGS